MATALSGTILTHTTVNRRRFLALAGGVAGSALLAACGSGSKATATPIIAATKPVGATVAAPTAAGTVTGSALASKQTVVIEAGEYFFKTNGSIPAGVTTIQLRNVGVENHEASIGRLSDGATVDQLIAALKSNDDGAAEKLLAPVGGPGVIAPQRTSEVTLELKEGKHVILCFVPNATGTPHAALGMVLPLTVTPNPAAVETLPTNLATIALRDTGFEWAAAPAAGKSAFRVVNETQAPSGFSVLRVLPGKTIDDVTRYFSGPPDGPFPIEGAGGTTAIGPGATAVVALDLPPGDYVAFTNDPSSGLKGFTIK